MSETTSGPSEVGVDSGDDQPARPPLRIGLRTPLWRPLPEIADFAVLAENLGFDTISVTDSPMLWRDTFCALAVIALRTERVTLSTAVTNPVNRTAPVLASASRTIAELAPGRFRLGLATGDSAVLLAGKRPATIAQLREAVRVIRDLLAGKPAYESAPNTTLHDPPDHFVPVFVAADGPKMMATAAEIGDGVITNNKNMVRKCEVLSAAAAEAGRPKPYHCMGASVRLTDDIERDARRLKHHVAKYVQREGPEYLESLGFTVNVPGRDFKLADGTDLAHAQDVEAAIETASKWVSDELAVWFAQNLAIWGDADFVTARLLDMWNLGVDEVLAKTDGAFLFPDELAHQLAEDVLPRVRAAGKRPAESTT
jgi:5,10-methylenetetrahydromethanopterin reductase